MSAPGRPAPDPMKGFRGVMAATLILESIVVLLTLLVLAKFGNSGGAFGVAAVLGLAVAMVLLCGFLRRSWALPAALVLQVALIACGLLSLPIGVIGVIFVLVWYALLMMRREVAARMARGDLPSQR